VSVIIPTYNQADFLKETLEALIAQTCRNWESVVVNNNSTDHTLDVIKGLNDDRIKVISFENKGVIAASRNLGARLAQADVLAFLDSDDIWEPRKLETSLAVLDNHDVVCHSEMFISKDGQHLYVKNYGPSSRANYRNLLFTGNCLSTSAVVMTRSAFFHVNGFSTYKEFITAEDYDLWLRLADEGFRFVFLDTVLGSYRVHERSSSNSLERHNRAVHAVINNHWERVSRLKTGKFWDRFRLRRRRALIDYSTAQTYAARGDYKSALCWLKKSFLWFPLVFRHSYVVVLFFFSIFKQAVGFR
jgi:glycosyltransferase involved in cell wall biosynthesis